MDVHGKLFFLPWSWLTKLKIVLLLSFRKVGSFEYCTRMANSALKRRIIILITARSFYSYNNVLINSCYTTFSIATFAHVYSMWISSTLGSEVLYLSHISAPQRVTYFLPNWPCRYGIAKWTQEVYGGSTGSCLFLSFLLLRIEYLRYFMAMWWMCFRRGLRWL